MKDENKQEPILPSQFSHLEEPLREAQRKIAELDREIENVPRDQGPVLRYNPPGFQNNNQLGMREQRISQLNQEKGKVKDDFSQNLDQDLAGVDPKLAKQVRDSVDIHLGNNSFKDLDNKELRQENTKPRDIDRSQDMMRKITSNYRANKDVNDVTPERTRDQDNKVMSNMPAGVATNYSNELIKAESKDDVTTDKDKEKQKGIDLDID